MNLQFFPLSVGVVFLLMGSKTGTISMCLHPLVFVVVHVAVGSSSVCQPAAAACNVPAPLTAVCAAVMPINN